MPSGAFRAIMRAMTEKTKRRLTTVMCADVQGYARLMQLDEAGTLATLRRHRAAMAALIERHDGRIVNTWGDAVIAEFASVVEAVQCAVEIQQELSNQDAELPDTQRMRFRIGINLGDVMVDGSDIYGDGVNIAARLQELAEPGGILVSGPVYEQVHDKLSIGFESLGRQPVKNVAAPVLSYRVTMVGASAGRPAPKADAELLNRPAAPALAGEGERTGRRQAASGLFASLPRSFAAVLVISVFLVLINLFSDPDHIWFHWPVTGMLFVVTLRAILRRKPARD
jgi:adenylate cyclase